MRINHILLAIASLLLITGIISVRLFTTEDTWLCREGRWVSHGNPQSPPPASGCDTSTETDTPTVTLIDAMRIAISKKYGIPQDTVVIEVETDTGSFAKGSVRFADQGGGAVWLAAVTKNQWQLVYDGQGPMLCSLSDQFHFPDGIITGCLDDQTGEFTDRE